MEDYEILEFVYARLINVYGENSNVDYMLNMKRIIDKMKTDVLGERAYG